MSEPWTRKQQINYATFGTLDEPPAWGHAWEAVRLLASATNCPLGTSIFAHFNKLLDHHHSASLSVD